MAKPFRMLLAVDLSETSSRTLEPAQAMAKRLSASVILVHAFLEPPQTSSLAVTVSEGPDVPYLEAEAEMHLQQVSELTTHWANRLRRNDIEAEVVARQGPAVDVILAAAEEFDVDLIVVGRHGMGRVRRFILGSITRKLAEEATRPLLIIPINE